MGCRCCWGHTGFASLEERFDPVTVHHICISDVNGSMSVSKTDRLGSSPRRYAKFLLGCGVIGNTTDFDSVVSGSIPDTPAKLKGT